MFLTVVVVSNFLVSTPLLEARNITFSYGKAKAIFAAASLKIWKGTFNCIVGESGIGKTTLLKLLYGEIFPKNGDILLSGHGLGKFNTEEIQKYRRICGLIFQDSFMIPDLTVMENIALPSILNGRFTPIVKERIYELSEQLGVNSCLSELPENISVGERQRSGIVRAVLLDPAIILADEPTGSLDIDNKIKCFYLLHQLVEKGRTVICATHDAEIVNWAKPNKFHIIGGKCIEQ